MKTIDNSIIYLWNDETKGELSHLNGKKSFGILIILVFLINVVLPTILLSPPVSASLSQNFIETLTPTYTISGNVYYSSTPLDGVKIELVTPEDWNNPLQTTYTVAGTYSISGISPGSYCVKAYGPTSEYLSALSPPPVEVISEDVTQDVYVPKLLTLVSPSYRESVTTLFPTLTWEKNPDATEYRLQVNVESTWDIVETGSSITNSYTIQNQLTPDVEYSWQVYAFDEYDHEVGATSMDFLFTPDGPENIVEEVSSVSAVGAPGPIIPLDTSVVPMIAGDRDTSPITSTVITASEYGDGRVVAMGHEGFLTNEGYHILDNARLARNIVAWLDAKHTHTVLVATGHEEFFGGSNMDSFKADLESRGYTVTRFSGILDSSALSDTGVLIIGTAWGVFSQEEIDAVADYLSDGGGLLMTGLGWSWGAYHPESTMDDYPMNQLGQRFGVHWEGGVITDADDTLNGWPVFHTFYPDIGQNEHGTYPDAVEYGGWMDVKEVRASSDDEYLTIKVIYDGEIPSDLKYTRRLYLGFDLDENPNTGESFYNCGAEKVIEINRGEFETGSLESYNDEGILTEYIDLPPELEIVSDPREIDVTFPYSLIGLAPAQSFDLGINSFSNVEPFNNIENPPHALTYIFGNTQDIEVDGNPSDWGGITSVFTNSPSGLEPSEFDLTGFYIADNSNMMFGRFDVDAIPTTEVIPNFMLDRHFELYIDADNNVQTGTSYADCEGVDYRFILEYGTDSFSHPPGTWFVKQIEKWDEIASSWYQLAPTDSLWSKTKLAFNSVFEFGIPISSNDLDITPDQMVKIYLLNPWFEAQDLIPEEPHLITITLGESYNYDSSTGSGLVYITPSDGKLEDISAVPLADIPNEGRPANLVFPHGIAALTLSDIPVGQTVTLSFELPINVPIDSRYWIYQDGGGWFWIPIGDDNGDKIVTISLTDGGLGDSNGLADGTIIVLGSVAYLSNSAPVLDLIDDKTVDEHEFLSFTVTAIDADSVALTFSIFNAPEGAYLDPASGLFSWTPSEACGGHTFEVTFIVSDGELTDQEIITITVNEVDDEPRLLINSVRDRWVNELQEVSFRVLATDDDTSYDGAGFGLENAPSGAEINPRTGVFKWTPSTDQGPSVYRFNIILSNDEDDVIDSEPITIAVNDLAESVPGHRVYKDTVEYGCWADIRDVDISTGEKTTITVHFDGAMPVNYHCARITNFAFDLDLNRETGGSFGDYTTTSYGSEAIIQIVTFGDGYHQPWVTSSRVGLWNLETAQYDWLDISETPIEVIWQSGSNELSLSIPESIPISNLHVDSLSDVFYTGQAWWDPQRQSETPELSFIYTFGSDSDIEVDGIATDWNDTTPALTRTEGGIDPQEFDWTALYLTDNSETLFGRLDVSSHPTLGPLLDFGMYRHISFYIDTDNNDQTGTIEYEFEGVEFQADIVYGQLGWHGYIGRWDVDESRWIFSWESGMYPEREYDSVFEWGIPISPDGLSIAHDQTVKIYLNYIAFDSEDVVPNDPWDAITYLVPEMSVLTSTGSGLAYLNAPNGLISDLTAISKESMPFDDIPTDITFPHGLLKFTSSEFTGGSASLGVELPSDIPVGSKWWMYKDGAGWSSIPIDFDDGDEFFIVTLTDGGVGDSDGVANGVIECLGGIGFQDNVPMLDPVGDKTVNEFETLQFTATAIDFDILLQTITFSLVDAPDDAGIDPETGVFSWNPVESNGPDTYTLTIVVSDGVLTDSETITVTVNEVNQSPLLGSIGNKAVEVGKTLRFIATATDPDIPANTLIFSLVGAPTGLSIDPQTGEFAWTPTSSQSPNIYTFDVVVSDGLLTDSETITVTVSTPLPPQTPPSPPPVEDIENETPEDAAHILEESIPEDAAAILESVSIETAVDIMNVMSSENATKILVEMNTTSAARILEKLDPDVAAYLLNCTDSESQLQSISSICLEMNQTQAAVVLVKANTTNAARIIEHMATQDLEKAAWIVEDAVKLIVAELDPVKQKEVEERVRATLENVSVEALVDLFIEIANLPATPSTVAVAFETMDLVKVLSVVTGVGEKGAWRELATIYSYLTQSTLGRIWNKMQLSEKVAISPYLNAGTIALLPKSGTFSISALSVTPSTVEPSKPVTVTVKVTNTGSYAGAYNVTLSISGAVADIKTVALNVGESMNVTFTVTKTTEGSYSVAVDGMTSSFTVKTIKPASFKLQNLKVSKNQVDPGEEITVTVTIVNEGDLGGSYSIDVKLDGITKSSETLILNSGESVIRIYKLSSDQVGPHTVDVDGMNSQFNVAALQQPTPDYTLYLTCSAGLVLVIVAVYFLFSKKK